ncbi:MAG: MFS transporter [Synechococcus sp. cluster2_bin.44]|nr:MFS transporter [Synechococcus sp. cluster2_bin.44]
MSGPSLSTPEPALPTGGNPEGNRGIQAVLALGDFRKLWLGQIFSQLADKFYIVLMVFLIDQHLLVMGGGGSGVLASMASDYGLDISTRTKVITLLATGIFVANTIPAMVLGTLAGVWADRWPKRRVMVASNALRALLVVFAPLFLLPGPLWLGLPWGYWGLVGMTFLESILTQFFAPSEQAAIPVLVPNEHLLAANSLYQATSMGATILGFALGEPILRSLHHLFAFAGIDGGEFVLLPLCYGLAALSLARLSLREAPKPPPTASVWTEIGEGLQVLRQVPSVRGAMLHLVLLYSLLAALYVLALQLAALITSLGPSGFGALLAMSGVGMAIGAIVIAQMGHRFSRRRLTASGLGTITWTLVLLSQLRGSLVFTLTLCGILGIGAAMVAIPAQTTIQEETPEAERGRVFGLQNNLINIALSLPLVLAGTLVSSLGLKPVLFILAGLALIAALLEKPWQRC